MSSQCNKWNEFYRSRTISAEEAARTVKSGDFLAFTAGRESFAIGLAVAARKDELKDVRVWLPTPGYDFGWYDEGWDDSFEVTVGMPTAVCQDAIDARRCDLNLSTLIPLDVDMPPPDVLLTEISPPDELGFCSFGASLWDKKRRIREAKLVIAEVNENLIRTYGDNYIHVSEIDYFVEHVSSGGTPGAGTLAGREIKEPDPYLKDIVGHVSSLIRDGDTVQIGVGRTTEPLVSLGLFKNKQDIGWHSEATPAGVITLVMEGVINGRRKTINTGLVTVASIGGSTRTEMQWVHNNPLFHVVDVAYLEDPRIIAAHDNMVAINNALAIDLTGQISAETFGHHKIRSLAGGQIAFVFGAYMSKGGRSVTVLPSTALGGAVSRIVPCLAEGTAVTIQRNLVDYVVTEWGIAHLKGKSIRQRANELIAIAHPDHRAELNRRAHEYFWP